MTTAESFDAFMRVVETACPPMRHAAFGLGWIVRSTRSGFRGVVVDVDPAYAQGADWLATPGVAGDPGFAADQPWYTAVGEDEHGYRTLYCSEATLEHDQTLRPVGNPDLAQWFTRFAGDRYDFIPRQDA